MTDLGPRVCRVVAHVDATGGRRGIGRMVGRFEPPVGGKAADRRCT